MADIPDDIRMSARDACDCKYCDWALRERVQTTCKRDAFARALLAERERCWQIVTDTVCSGLPDSVRAHSEAAWAREIGLTKD